MYLFYIITKQITTQKAFVFFKILQHNVKTPFDHFGEDEKKPFDEIYDLYKMQQFHWLQTTTEKASLFKIFQYYSKARPLPRTLPTLANTKKPFDVIHCLYKWSNLTQGSRVGVVVRALAFHQCVPGSIPGPGVTCGLSLLVLYSAPRGFSPGTPVFPSPQKPTFDLIWFIWFYSLPN